MKQIYYRPNKNAWFWKPSKYSKKEFGPFQTYEEAVNEAAKH